MAEPQSFAGLLGGSWRDMAFEPFRDGVEICRLVTGAPEVALLRYAPGASVPRHLHRGLETFLVLEGAQSDERGTYAAGTLAVNPVGSVHSVASEAGCIVLIQWTSPIEIL
ncbi:MAG: cupin domain-containing protein [Alphaproteobacteria bacterium]|nr:cupin domain-containing protein [Alphaproteobacteria bacterium]